MKTEKILISSLLWRKHPTNEKYFYCNFNNEMYILRINNFPEEPLVTLINGFEIFDLDEMPSGWSFEG